MDEVSFLKTDAKQVRYNLENLKQIVFEVTDACNLRCKYCAYSELYDDYDAREGNFLTINKAISIIDYLVKLWKNKYYASQLQPMFISFYGGEPLMNMRLVKDIIDYLETTGNVGKQFLFSMTTNAMLLDKYMDYLAEKEFRLLISLDGDKYNQSYRVDTNGKNSFDRVFNNIKKLQEKYPNYFQKYVNFNSVLHNRNSVESCYHFIKNNFSKGTRISPLNNSGIRNDRLEEFRNTYQNLEESMQQSTNCEALEAEMFITAPKTSKLLSFIYHYSENVYENYNDLFVDNNKRPTYPTGTCFPFSKKMFITVNGKILQCERINHNFFVGNVFDDRVEMDWKKIANQYNDYIFRYVKQCKNCSINKKCVQCVFQIDDINSLKTKCLSFRNSLSQNKYIESNIQFLREHPELYGRIMKEVYVSS